MRKLLTASQAAALSGMSADAIRWHTRNGSLKPAARAQGVALYAPGVIRAWSRTVTPRGRKAA